MEIVLHKNPSSQATVLTQRNITYKYPCTILYSKSAVLRNKFTHLLLLSFAFKIRLYDLKTITLQKVT